MKRSGFSSQSSDGDIEDPDVKLRSYVRKFLALRMNKDVTKATDMIESQKKTVSFAINQRKKYLDNKVILFNFRIIIYLSYLIKFFIYFFWKNIFQINNLNVANEQNKDAGFIEERKAMSPDNKLDLDEKRSKYIIYDFNIILFLIFK